VSNPVALNWLQHALLSAPAGRFSITRFRDTLKSQGVPVAEETLETIVLLELERRGYRASWVKVGDDNQSWEVDFLAEQPCEQPLLLQVCLDADADPMWERAVGARVAALRLAGRDASKAITSFPAARRG